MSDNPRDPNPYPREDVVMHDPGEEDVEDIDESVSNWNTVRGPSPLLKYQLSDRDETRLFEPFTCESFTRDCVENVSWLDNYIQSLRDLLDYKLGIYQSAEFASLFASGTQQGGDSEEKTYPLRSQKKAKGDQVEVKRHPQLVNLIKMVQDQREAVGDRLPITEVREFVKGRLHNAVKSICTLTGREEYQRSLLDTLFAFQRNFRVFIMGYLSFAFLGSPGTGKTRLANSTASFFQNALIISNGTTEFASRSSLVAGYLGQTAINVRKKMLNSLESVFFLDEAYNLTRCNDTEDAYGMEAITEIVDFMSKFKCLHIVIVAGYQYEMEKCFFTANEGLPRRFSRKIVLQDYTTDELVRMLEGKLVEARLLTPTNIPGYLQLMLHHAIATLKRKGGLQYQGGDIENFAVVVANIALACREPGYTFGSFEYRVLDAAVLRRAVDTFLDSKNIAPVFSTQPLRH